MAAKMLDEVLEKERIAAQKEQDAKLEAQRIVDEAEKKAAEIIAAAQKQVIVDEQLNAVEAQRQAQELLDSALAQTQEQIEQFAGLAQDRFSEAVGKVKEIISR